MKWVEDEGLMTGVLQMWFELVGWSGYLPDGDWLLDLEADARDAKAPLMAEYDELADDVEDVLEDRD